MKTKSYRTQKNIAIIVAAGTGSRMEAEIPKQFLELGGEPILTHTLRAFDASPLIDEIVLVVGAEPVNSMRQDVYVREEIVDRNGFRKVRHIVQGGRERHESVRAGLACCTDAAYIFVQDAVRPFVTEKILERGWETVCRFGTAICGMPSKDTIKVTDESGRVLDTPDRSRTWIVQTPQIFAADLLRRAYDKLGTKDRGITDDAMVVERAGGEVHMFPGDYRNIKITTPEDLLLAEALQ